MNPIIATILAAVAAAAGLILLTYLGLLVEAVDLFRDHGKVIIVIVQVVGIFWCGMMGKFKLGAVLVFTVLATIFWGW